MKFNKIMENINPLNEVKISKVIQLAKNKDPRLKKENFVNSIQYDNSDDKMSKDEIEINFENAGLNLSEYPHLLVIAKEQDTQKHYQGQVAKANKEKKDKLNRGINPYRRGHLSQT